MVAALAAAAGGWLYVTGLQAENAKLTVKVEQLIVDKQQADRNALALADQLVTVQARAAASAEIKEAIREAPSGPVPADIRAALERLRDH